MSGGRDAPGSGFQTADPAEMRGHTDGASAITTHSSSGTARGDCRSFTAARPARRARQGPGIIGAAIENIVRLPRHQQLGRVGHAHNDRSSSAQAGDQRRIAGCNQACSQACPRFATKPGNLDRTLDADWNPMQRSHRFPPHHSCFCRLRLTTSTFGVELHKRIQLRIQRLDSRQMSIE